MSLSVIFVPGNEDTQANDIDYEATLSSYSACSCNNINNNNNNNNNNTITETPATTAIVNTTGNVLKSKL